jgi:hypothetical protein
LTTPNTPNTPIGDHNVCVCVSASASLSASVRVRLCVYMSVCGWVGGWV